MGKDCGYSDSKADVQGSKLRKLETENKRLRSNAESFVKKNNPRNQKQDYSDLLIRAAKLIIKLPCECGMTNNGYYVCERCEFLDKRKQFRIKGQE